jgi:hypothetical protein
MRTDIQQLFADHFTDENGQYIDRLENRTVATLFDKRLFKCFLPPEYGGLGLDHSETAEIIESCSYLNGSLGWLIQIGNGGMYFARNFDKATSLELFTPKDAVIAGSGAPCGKGSRTPEGYVISGKWPYCSGSDYATLFTVTFSDEEDGEIFAAILPREQVIRIKNWNAIGMRNTSTDTIELHSVVVPDHHVFRVAEQGCLTEVPLFQQDFTFFAQVFFLNVVFGIFQRFLDEGNELLERKKEHWAHYFPGRIERLKNALNKGTEQLCRGKGSIQQLLSDDAFGKLVENTTDPSIPIQITLDLRNCAHELYGMMGIEVLDAEHVISVCYCDLIAVSQHYLLTQN